MANMHEVGVHKGLVVYGELKKDIDKPTKDVIADIMTQHGFTVSARTVQRVRKEIKDSNPTVKGNEKVSDKDTFDTGLDSDEISIINMANEGDWTIQQIADGLNLEIEDVRNTINDNHFMITSEVLDEENPKVYNKPTVESMVQKDVPIPDYVNAGINESSRGEDSFWEVEIDTCTACSKAKQEVKVFMGRVARKKAMLYMKWAGACEWLAYLVGEQLENGDYNVYDLYLPDQRVSATLVDKVVAESYNHMSIVGVIHSHHEMGAGDENNPSFSGHDAAFINGNHNLSLLAGRDTKTKGFKIVGIARTKTPCDALMKVKAAVKAMAEEPDAEETEMKNEFMTKAMSSSNKNAPSTKTIGGQTYTVGPNGVIDTRSGNYHFNGQHSRHGVS